MGALRTGYRGATQTRTAAAGSGTKCCNISEIRRMQTNAVMVRILPGAGGGPQAG